MQASYTDFHYLRPVWKETTEADALIGVGITGIASGDLDELDLVEAATTAERANRKMAEKLGINPAARVTTVKPSGTSSIVLGCSSGVHAWHNDFYIRRMRVNKNESMYQYLSVIHPELVVDEHFSPDTTAVIEIPQAAPKGATLRTESPIDLLQRVRRFNTSWVAAGHVRGENRNNVSCTISLKDDEWDEVGMWMWTNQNLYNGISILPYDGGTYIQAPFEDITEAEYILRSATLTSINLANIIEADDTTDLSGELACSGGACEIT